MPGYDGIDLDRTGAQRCGPSHRAMPERTTHVARAMPTAARFGLSAARLPSLADALAVGDRIRMALLRCSDGHPVFAGRDAAGQVVRGPRHEHAWFLPADDAADDLVSV